MRRFIGSCLRFAGDYVDGVQVRHLAALLFALVAPGCGGPGSPAVMPNMQTMPDDDPLERGEYLDSTHARPAPEQRAGQSPKERRAEEIAATAAAVIGMMFSSTKTVLLGTESKFDENAWIVGEPKAPPESEDAAESDRPGRDCSPRGRLSLDPRAPSEPCRPD